MADFGGFNFKTPDEIRAEREAMRQQSQLSGNQSVQRAGNIETAISALLGNPELKKAKLIEERLSSAQQRVQATPSEDTDPIDTELRRLTAMRDAVVQLDPSLASQINTQMLTLGEAKFQKDRLKAKDARDEAKEGREVTRFGYDKQRMEQESALLTATGGNTYVYDPATNSAQSFNLLNPEDSPKFSAAAGKKGNVVISGEQLFGLYKDTSLEAMRMRRALASADTQTGLLEKRDIRKAAGALADTYATSERIFDVLSVNPDALTSTSKVATAVDKLSYELGAAGRSASGGKTIEGQSIDGWLKSNSITNTRLQGLVIGLAYSRARMMDPAGKISDQDLEAAKLMVGSNNPTPAALLANLNDALEVGSMGMYDRFSFLEEADPGFIGPIKATLDARKSSFHTKFNKYRQGTASPATGTPALPAQSSAPRIVSVRKK